MKRNHFLSLLIPVALILLFFPSNIFARMSTSEADTTTSSWGNNSTSYGGGSPYWDDTIESECRFCHEDLDRFPQLDDTNPNKHHLLTGKLVEPPVIAPYASEGDTYECSSCHGLTWSESTSSLTIEVIRDCLQCHPVETVTGSPHTDNRHHRTETFYQFNCTICHQGHR
ncbi:MAG: hypothetical protein KQH63_00960 [Desulfobulbaceae bacterium]|nr:hypothetical protein [Desulfobulbaceae bacterium]